MSTEKKDSNFTRTCSKLSQFLKERRSLGDQNCFAFSHMPSRPSSKLFDFKRVEEELGSKKGTDTVDLFTKNMEREENVSADDPIENHKSLNLFPLTSPSTEKSPQITTNLRELARATEEPKTRSPSMTIFYGGRVVVFNEFPENKVEEIMHLASQNQNRSSPSNEAMTTTQHNQNTACAESGDPSSDLPIARRTSLFRFIEKRKDRVASAVPYQIHNPYVDMANPNPQRLMSNQLCRQQKEKQQQLELKL